MNKLSRFTAVSGLVWSGLGGCLLLSGCRTGSPADAAEGTAKVAAAAAPETPAPAPEAPAYTPPATVLPHAPGLSWWRTSMNDRDARLSWWRQARFGMFVHWGVYSSLGGVWQGQPVKGYAEHIQRIRKIPRSEYLAQVASKFRPSEFDADAWISAAKQAGMGYFIITAKHHDGFAMYDSKVSDYNVVKATPWQKDPMASLATAARKQGVKFGFYYSHAFDWGEKVGIGNDWEHDNPGGDKLLHGGRDWWVSAPQFLERARQYVDNKAIPQLVELIGKYDPDILWFDTPHKLPPEENLRILEAVRKAKPDIVINGRIVQAFKGAPPARYGDYASTADRPAEFPPQVGDWEAIPTTNESYGWHQQDDSHKSAGFFITLLAKAAARGGNVLLNIGPRGDGRIDGPDAAILEGVGRWMKANQASIVGTTRTPLPVQAWGESTRRGDTLYLHVLAWPKQGRLVVGGLRRGVKRAYLLADPRQTFPVSRSSDRDVSLLVPARAPDPNDSVIALDLEGEPATDSVRLLSSDVDVDILRAFDGRISPGLAFGAGKVRDAWVNGWRKSGQWVSWPVRLNQPGRFAVSVSYDAEANSEGGKYEVIIGKERLAGTVAARQGRPVRLGEVALPGGSFNIEVRGLEVKGGELFKLRGVELVPVRDPAQVSSSQ